MHLSKIPATVVTGFLGSGKTTLLSQVLKQAAGKRIAVIVNEFGELDVDAELLRSCSLDCDESAADVSDAEQGIYELANGCICCTVEEEFLPVMQQLVARREKIDHILIETSGLALPKPLVQAFNWPEIKQYCTVDAVITVLDGPAVADGRYASDADKVQQQRLADPSLDHDPSLQELLDDQLSAADMVLVSKNDLLSAMQRQQVQEMIADRLPAAVKTAYVSYGDVPQELLLNQQAASEERIETVHTHHDHHHHHGERHTHAHDHFDSCVITLGEVDSGKLLAVLMQLLDRHAIYRTKGFAALPGKPMRQVIQAVGTRVDSHFDRLWGIQEERLTCLVFIGKNLDQVQLHQALLDAAVTT